MNPSRRSVKATRKLLGRKPGIADADGRVMHWKCGSCGMPCYCVGDARLMLHVDCGVDGDPGDRDHVTDAIEQQAASWKRDGMMPGGIE